MVVGAATDADGREVAGIVGAAGTPGDEVMDLQAGATFTTRPPAVTIA